MVLRRRRRRYFDALKRPAHDASQNPVHDADDKNDLVLGTRKLPKENVHQRDRPEHYAQTKPPDNPAVNPNMDVTHKSTPLNKRRASVGAGLYSRDGMAKRHNRAVCSASRFYAPLL